MISAIWSYFAHEILPRIRKIFLSSDFIGALIVTGLLYFVRTGRYFIQVSVGDIIPHLLTYASIAFGFSLAGLTLALTLPDREFVNLMFKSVLKDTKTNAFQDLLFVFSWTAICHWVLIIISIFIIIFFGPDQSILEIEINKKNILFWAVIFISIYCFFQFLITLITLSQVGRIYIAYQKSKNDKQQV